MRFSEVIRSLDWVLMGAALLLVLIGLAMLFSATYTQEGVFASRFFRQLIAFVVAFGVCLVMARVHYHSLRRYAPIIYLLGLIGLGVVAASSQVIRGTISRITVGGFQLQPSEFMKISLVIVLGWVLARSKQFQWRSLWHSGVLVAIPVALILLEPDLGVALLLIATWGALLVFMGLPWSMVSGLSVLGLGALAVAWQFFFAEYQKARLLVFLDPTNDPLGAGYNVVQSIVALGSGRWWGRGHGHGPQSQLKFLPEQHTDFIVASIGEELGFLGVAGVIILYIILLWRILQIARNTRDPFGQITAVTTFLILLISFMVSASMNMGLLPVTGIPLPLVSYGGSNLVTTFVLLGIVQSVRVYSKWVQEPPTEISHFI